MKSYIENIKYLSFETLILSENDKYFTFKEKLK